MRCDQITSPAAQRKLKLITQNHRLNAALGHRSQSLANFRQWQCPLKRRLVKQTTSTATSKLRSNAYQQKQHPPKNQSPSRFPQCFSCGVHLQWRDTPQFAHTQIFGCLLAARRHLIALTESTRKRARELRKGGSNLLRKTAVFVCKQEFYSRVKSCNTLQWRNSWKNNELEICRT